MARITFIALLYGSVQIILAADEASASCDTEEHWSDHLTMLQSVALHQQKRDDDQQESMRQSSDQRNTSAMKPSWQLIVAEDDIETVPKEGHSHIRGHSHGKSSVTGPISDENSSSGVNATEDMIKFDFFAESLRWVPHSHHFHKKFCQNCKAIVDYERISATLGGGYIAMSTVIGMGLVILWMMATTAGDFFVPPLLYWTERLKLPPEIAGATILAIGNGAEDIFDVCAAAHHGDIPLALSEMLGSNMFTLCVSGGCVVLFCHTASKAQDYTFTMPTMSDAQFITYLGTYALMGGLMAWVVLIGRPTLVKALLLPLLYFFYLAMIWYSRDRSLPSPTLKSGEEEPSEKQPELVPAGLSSPRNASPLQMAAWCLGAPSYLIRHACIPSVDGQWGARHRLASSFAPIAMLAFCASTNVGNMQNLHLHIFISLAILACLLGATIYCCSDSRRALPWFYPAVPTFAIFATMIWMSVLAAEVTAIVEAIGYASKVPRLVLGFSAIAWGNCLADLMVIVATIRRGHVTMAISAILAAPLITDLLAFGLSLIMTRYERGGMPVMCGEDCPLEFKKPLITSLCCVFAGATLLIVFLRYPGSCSKWWTAGLWGLYLIFLVLVLVIEEVDAPIGEKIIK